MQIYPRTMDAVRTTTWRYAQDDWDEPEKTDEEILAEDVVDAAVEDAKERLKIAIRENPADPVARHKLKLLAPNG